MAAFSEYPIQTISDIVRFETEKAFEERVIAKSVYDLFTASVERHPDRPALTMLMTGADDETARVVSYRDFLKGVTRSANLFHSLAGDAPGVAYILPNLVETHFTLWGAESVGYAVPINFLLQAEHIADLVRASGAKILVALGPHPVLDIWQKALAVKAMLPEIKLIQVSPPGVPTESGALNFAEGLAQQAESKLTSGRPRSGDDVAAYFHTGGTTGAPKLVAHSHRNQIVAAFGGAVLLDYSETDVMTCNLPLFHVGGTIVAGLSLLLSGANLLIMSPGGMRNPVVVQNFWKIVERYRATILGSVPTGISALLNVPIDGDLSSVRICVVGASPTPRAVAEQFEAMTGKRLHEVLGMTETAGLVTIAPAAATPVIGSVGLRLPYTKVVVRRLGSDGELGKVCEAGEIGVLAISGPTATAGYRNGPQTKARDGDLVIDSGDLAYTDENGRIFIAGRSKDLIIRSGHNIDPAMIEDAIQSHPAVAMAAAVGQPDKYAGELPVCYVTLKPGANVGVPELREHAEQHIAERPAWPKRIYIIETLPVTGVGKIFKPELRNDAAKRLVSEIVCEMLGDDGADVRVTQGGERGMDVQVTLPSDSHSKRDAVEQSLGGYIFTYRVN